MLSLILLSSTTNNTWTLLFMPTIIMVCTLPLWFIKQLHNSFLSLLATIGYIGFIILLFIACATDKGVQSPGIIGGIFLAIPLLLLNAYPYILYRRWLNNNRCPNCHNLGLKRLNKSIDTITNSQTTIYSVSGGKYNGKEYQRNVDHIYKYTHYTNYCHNCNSVIFWTEEDQDTLKSDNRPDEVRQASH